MAMLEAAHPARAMGALVCHSRVGQQPEAWLQAVVVVVVLQLEQGQGQGWVLLQRTWAWW